MSGLMITHKTVQEFLDAVNGPKGALDAWLEVNSEEEVRQHILAVLGSRKVND